MEKPHWVIMSLATHHFLHGDIVGKQLGDDVSIGQKHIADGLEKKTTKKRERNYKEIFFFPLLCKVSLGFLKGAIQIQVIIIITIIIKNVVTCTEKKWKTSVLHFYFVTCK